MLMLQPVVRFPTRVVDRTSRRRIAVEGAHAAAALNGLLTNDVAALDVGEGLYAVSLSAKGKILADVRVFRTATGFITDTGAAAGNNWAEIVRKYVNPRFAQHRDISTELTSILVVGPDAEAIVGSVVGIDPELLHTLPAFAAIEGAYRVIAAIDVDAPAFEVFVPVTTASALIDRLVSRGAVVADEKWLRTAQIQRGWPVWGEEMDDTMLAQEANMDELGAISYSKGCYTGQETVARLHFRGHVNRLLRRICFIGAPPAAGTPLLTADGTNVGEVRSAATTMLDIGAGFALVRREVEPDTHLAAGSLQVLVNRLPYQPEPQK